MKIVLASQSPRRKDMLENLGLPFRIRVHDTDETYPPEMPVRAVPEYLAKLKARAVLPDIKKDEIILAADTIVLKEEKIIGKPKDREDAVCILKELSGQMHEVISGVCLLSHAGQQHSFSETTKVFFSQLTEAEITTYIDEFQPFDKAGAYAIQERIGMIGIRRIEGCYFNVVGLPLNRVYQEWRAFLQAEVSSK